MTIESKENKKLGLAKRQVRWKKQSLNLGRPSLFKPLLRSVVKWSDTL